MGLFDRFKKKKEETINTDGVMISTTYRFIEDEYIRIAIEYNGTDGITGLDKDQLTEKLLYFYDNNLPVTERINILMNTFDIEEETAKQIEYVSFARTSLLADYLRNKERGATKFNIKGANRILKKNILIKEFPKHIGFMIENDAIPVFNIKQLPKKRFSRNKVKSVPKKETIPAPETSEIETKEAETINKYYKPIIREASNPRLDELMDKQSKLHDKALDKSYYESDKCKEEFKEINKEIKQYLEDNPKDFISRGANDNGMLLEVIRRVSEEELNIMELLGKGLYYEDLGQYDEAIALYREVDRLNNIVFRNEINELIKDVGKGDYLYSAKAKQRIDICYNKKERAKIKELEAEAKELSETNPAEAIKLYERLNILNPNLKKYDNAIFKIREAEAKELSETNPAEAIKIYEELKKAKPNVKKYDRAIIKIYEAEAKELEKTNPAEAIKKYQELNIKNPNLKKYDKRIEILERKLDK